MATRRLLEIGRGWRIGEGMTVNIWNEPWIPGQRDGRINCQKIITKYTCVVDLIHKADGTWNEESIREVVEGDQVEAILSIPIDDQSSPNTKIWRVDNIGTYSVKSGYKLLLQQTLQYGLYYATTTIY